MNLNELSQTYTNVIFLMLKLEGINKKYKILEEKYPDIIKALLDTLFPSFFRDIIREEYMKNVTIKSNLSR